MINLPPNLMRNPEWDKAGKVHDWRNHVPEDVRSLWHTFTDTQQMVLFLWADQLAERKEWE